MTPQIALDLSLDSIMVLSRAPDGGWLREGTVRLEDDDMPARLAELRDVAERRVGEDFVSILILPDSQLLYTSFERDDRRPDETIRALLKGRTPYAVEDLTWDYVERGDRLQVSVVALETLMEAESFAAEYGFQPVVAVGNPQSGPFAAIPNFGPTGLARDLLAGAPLDLQLEHGFSARPAPPLPAAPSAEVVPEPKGAEEDIAPQQDAIAEIPTPAEAVAPSPAPESGDGERTVEGTARNEARDDTETPSPSTPGDLPFAALVEAGREAEAMPPLAASRAAAPADSGARLAKVPPRLSAPRTDKAPRPAVPTIDDAAAAKDRPRLRDVVAQVRESGRTAAPTAGERARADLRAAAEVGRAKAQRPDEQAASPPTDDLPPLAAPGTWAHRVKLQLAEAEAGGPAPADMPAAGKPDRTAPDTRARRAPTGRAPARRSSAKLGLVLTLGLLAALVLVGLGAAMIGREPGEATASDLLSELLPEAQAPARATLVALPTADIEAEASTPSELIAPPSPLAAPMPVILDDEARSSGELAPTLAAAPTFEAQPNPETEPAILVTEWMAEGQFVAPDLAQPGANGTVPTDLPASGPSRLVAALTPDAPVLPVVPSAPATVLDPPPATLADSREAALGLTPATTEGVVVDGSYTVLIGRPDAMPAPRPGGVFDRVVAPDDQSAAPEAVTEPEPQVTRSELPDSTGILVIPGRPAVETRPRPALSEVTPAEPVDPATDILRRVRPVERPETVLALADIATPEEALPAELAVLRRVRPVERPASVAQAEAAARAAIEAAQAAQEAAEQEAAAVDAAAQSAAASLAQAAAAATASVSDLALPRSARPQTRPRAVERIAARMSQERREQQAAAPQPQSVARAQQQAAPQIRSAGGNVAAAATERNALRLNQTNLIGVYGRPNDRRALVRLRNGRYVKVEVGDRLDRGRVTAIGDDRLQYQRGNRNVVLQLPRT